MVLFYDDRTGGSAGELVQQDMLTIENNKITMDKSEFVVSGIDRYTVNNINISFKNNELVSEILRLYDKSCDESNSVKIKDK